MHTNACLSAQAGGLRRTNLHICCALTAVHGDVCDVLYRHTDRYRRKSIYSAAIFVICRKMLMERFEKYNRG
jgi:hypothetical protein